MNAVVVVVILAVVCSSPQQALQCPVVWHGHVHSDASEPGRDLSRSGPGAGPSLSIHIDPHWQKSRLVQCNARKAQYQTMGLWVQGDAAPIVDRQRWQALSARQKADVFDIAACIGNAGQVLEISVSVLDRETGKALETRHMISDRDFEQPQE